MIRRFQIIALAVLLAMGAAGSALAQRGMGGGRGGAGGVRTMPSPVTAPPATFSGRPVAPAGPRGPAFVGHAPGTVVGPVFNGHHGGTHFRGNAFVRTPTIIVGQPFFDPFFWGAPLYSTPYYTGQPYSEPSYAAPPVSQGEADLQYEIQQLSQQIEQLRQQQLSAPQVQQYQAPPPPAAAAVPAIPTILVFRDGHQMQIQNYAIVGDAMWVVDQQNATKIPLSELDLDATQQLNRARGVRFSIPGK